VSLKFKRRRHEFAFTRVQWLGRKERYLVETVRGFDEVK
jgi:hypothetical protein